MCTTPIDPTPITVKVKKTRPESNVTTPTYATSGSACVDLQADILEPTSISPGERVKIPTGIAIEMPSPFLVGLIFARSGLSSRHGVALANSVGVIDSDYRGEIICAMQNLGSETYVIQPGDRIAQLAFMPVTKATLQVVDTLGDTERGAGGFGSTGG